MVLSHPLGRTQKIRVHCDFQFQLKGFILDLRIQSFVATKKIVSLKIEYIPKINNNLH